MKNILVLCTGNSCRSQLAEGYLKYFAGDKANVYSAGVETHGVNPKAIATMQKDGIDISGHTSNNILEYSGIEFDYTYNDEKDPNRFYYRSDHYNYCPEHYNFHFVFLLLHIRAEL